MACSIHQPPSPTMRRRLQQAAAHGWLLRLHRSDCSQVSGSVAWLDPGMQRCLLATPDALQPEHDVFLDEIVDVAVITVAFLSDGRIQARLAQIAPWCGGASGGDTVIADQLSGTLAVGEEGMLLLADGARRRGVVVGVSGLRCRIRLP